jgi:hypothetical protein
VQVLNNQLIKLSCAGSELLPRRSLCLKDEEEKVQVVNNQLILCPAQALSYCRVEACARMRRGAVG